MQWFVAPPARAGLQCPINKEVRRTGTRTSSAFEAQIQIVPSAPALAALTGVARSTWRTQSHKSVKFYTMAGTAMPRSHRGTGVSPVNDWAV